MINRPLFENRIRICTDRSPSWHWWGASGSQDDAARQFVARIRPIISTSKIQLVWRLAEPMTALAPLSGLVVIDGFNVLATYFRCARAC
ncbi:MAG: hypothetical protein IPP41_07775 [Rhodocyclaceae bacterium]|nr:hypothetical protein [Rhodocyclaceae bacterium]